MYGKNVISIDQIRGELEESKNDSFKIVMDADDLKFLDARSVLRQNYLSPQ